MANLELTRPWKSARLYAGAVVAGIATLASVGVLAPTAWAATGVITPSVTASGTPGITSTVRTITTTTTNPTTVHIDLHFSVTQPANICRLSTGTCPPGYPAWQANLTITGYEAAGLTFDSANGGFACSEAAGVLSCHIDYLNNYFKNFDVYFTAAPTYGGDVSANLAVYDTTPADAAPTSKDQCKSDGWTTFTTIGFQSATIAGHDGYMLVFTPRFRNQGDCVSSVVSNSHSVR